MKLEGIHHISAITADATGNVEFYTGVLGMRMVKRTVNQDEPAVYHLMLALRKTGRDQEAHAALEQLVSLRTNSKVNDAPVRRYHLYEEHVPPKGAPNHQVSQ